MTLFAILSGLIVTQLIATLALAGLVLLIILSLPMLSPAQRHTVTLSAFVTAALLPLAIFFPASGFSLASLPVLVVPPVYLTVAVLLFWLAGAIWFFSRLAISLLKMNDLIRTSSDVESIRERAWIVRAMGLKFSEKIKTPLVAGLFKPVVLVPETMDDQLNESAVRGLIEHECAHIERHDLWVSLFQRIVLAIYWWNPAMHWLAARLDEDREMACDDVAAHRLGDPRVYASTILDVSDSITSFPNHGFSAAAIGTQKGLVGRMRRLMDQPSSLTNPMIGLALVVIILMTGTMLAAAAPRVSLSIETPETASIERHHSPRLLEAIRGQTDPIVRTLLAQGADPNTRLENDQTPLSEALASGRFVILEILLEAGADPNTQMPNGEYAIHWALRSGYEENIFILIDHGADINQAGPDGTTPLDLAMQRRHEQIIQRLLQEGARDE
jgi:beta-lactamase regulating signal transducer with metallopeptidase domain